MNLQWRQSQVISHKRVAIEQLFPGMFSIWIFQLNLDTWQKHGLYGADIAPPVSCWMSDWLLDPPPPLAFLFLWGWELGGGGGREEKGEKFDSAAIDRPLRLFFFSLLFVLRPFFGLFFHFHPSFLPYFFPNFDTHTLHTPIPDLACSQLN
jgi:hypothetical protein